MQRLGDSVQEAWTAVAIRLTRAQETRAVDDLHALRIATKVLRYRTELLYDVGARATEGRSSNGWQICKMPLASGTTAKCSHQAVAEAVARAEILLNEMQTVRILLAELEKDRSRQAKEVEKIFRLANRACGESTDGKFERNRCASDAICRH